MVFVIHSSGHCRPAVYCWRRGVGCDCLPETGGSHWPISRLVVGWTACPLDCVMACFACVKLVKLGHAGCDSRSGPVSRTAGGSRGRGQVKSGRQRTGTGQVRAGRQKTGTGQGGGGRGRRQVRSGREGRRLGQVGAVPDMGFRLPVPCRGGVGSDRPDEPGWSLPAQCRAVSHPMTRCRCRISGTPGDQCPVGHHYPAAGLRLPTGHQGGPGGLPCLLCASGEGRGGGD